MTRFSGSKDIARLQRHKLAEVNRMFRYFRDEDDSSEDIHLLKLAEAISTEMQGPLIASEAVSKGVEYDKVRLEVVRKALAKSEKLVPVEAYRQEVQKRIREATNIVELTRIKEEVRITLETWRK